MMRYCNSYIILLLVTMNFNMISKILCWIYIPSFCDYCLSSHFPCKGWRGNNWRSIPELINLSNFLTSKNTKRKITFKIYSGFNLGDDVPFRFPYNPRFAIDVGISSRTARRASSSVLLWLDEYYAYLKRFLSHTTSSLRAYDNPPGCGKISIKSTVWHGPCLSINEFVYQPYHNVLYTVHIDLSN